MGYQIVSFPTRSFRDWPVENFNALSQKIKLTTPKRKNQKIKNTIKEKNLLKKRYIIEHLNAKIHG